MTHSKTKSSQSIRAQGFEVSQSPHSENNVVALQEEIRSLKRQNEDLRSSLHEDDLTGLYNARALRERLGEILSAQKTTHENMALLFIDVDRFKDVNELHGHQAAGRVLEQIGRLIGRVIRTHDIAFRYGGDEFVVLVSGGNFGARLVGERIRKSIEAHRFKVSGLQGEAHIQVTVSIGARTLKSDDTMDSLLESADRAMFEAKRNSRNAFVAA